MLKTTISATAICLATTAFAQETTGNADAGETVFRQCSGCHSVELGQNRAGPSLAGIIGREIGSVDGFRYSSTLAESSEIWDAEMLTAFLTAPREAMPGTRKTVSLRDPDDAADLIAYLATLGG